MGKYNDWTRGEEEALLNVLGGIEVARRLISGTTRAVIKTVERLIKIGSVDVPDIGEMVITEELLREKGFGWFGDNFRNLFFGKTEKGAKGKKLVIYKLQENATGQQLKDELGDGAVTAFANLLSLVEKQKKGESGVLLTDGSANIVIVEVEENDGKGGKKNVLWAVCAYWSRDARCWFAYADPISYPFAWSAGNRVFSSDS